MKKIFLFVLVTSFVGNSLLAQKTINDPNVEKRSIGSFHGINVSTGITLWISEGNSEEVAVSTISTLKKQYRQKPTPVDRSGIREKRP